MGAGIPNNNPSKPPKNAGLVKITKGLTTTPAVKDTKWKFTGTLDNCTNMPTAPKTGTPITSGSLQLQVELPPGSTCSNIVPGTPVKASLKLKWNAIDPSTNKVKNGVAQDKFKGIQTFEREGAGAPITLNVSTSAISDPKSLFIGKHFDLHFVMDETQAQLDANCPGPKNKGITLLHFTGPNSVLTVVNP